MPTPLLSVCLITYNHQKYIRRAIEGVLVQKVNFDWEFIIADDFSTDGTRAILQEYQLKYPDRIKLILQEKNVGPAQNWFDLINAPESKYIAYFEGDDYWTDADKLQQQVDFLEANEHCSFCFHKAFKTKNDEIDPLSSYPRNIGKPVLNTSDFFKIPTIPTASIVYRNGITFPQLDHSHGDYLLYCALLSKGSAGYIDKEMAVYRLHHQGVSSKYKENWYLERRINELNIEKNFPQFSNDVRREISKLLVEHTLFYLNKNREKLTFSQKKYYTKLLMQSNFWFHATFKEIVTLAKTLLK